MDAQPVATIFSIVVICNLLGMGLKTSKKVKDEAIPVCLGVAGGILGVVGMFVIPDFPATDIMNAISIGIVSGLGSVGVNQIKRQMTTKNTTE